jgi:RNA-directed DNA polymerase
MNWENYKRDFTQKAIKEGYKDVEIELFLNYAFKLYQNNCPIIYELNHLSLLVGYKKNYLIRAIIHTPYFYRTYEIPKKNGTKRKISEPLPSLKEIQYWILNEILINVQISKYAKAYVKKRSLKGNARFHIGKEIILTLDIENFFGSIKSNTVESFFINIGYSSEISNFLSKLCCLNDSLPQGAPTSPSLSNIIFVKIDDIIAHYCKYNNINYTRYADDLTFSGSFNPGMVIKFIESLLKERNFKLNYTKIRTRRQNQRQEVTGVVVNNKMQAPKELRKDFRKSIYYIKKFGIDSHINHENIKRDNYLSHLIGIGNHIYFVNPKDIEIKKGVIFLSELKKQRDNALS